MISAMPSPSRRASACLSSGSLSTRIEMNTMLSMPRTISKASNVKKATQTSGFSNKSTPDTSPFCYRSCAGASPQAVVTFMQAFMPPRTPEEPPEDSYSATSGKVTGC